MISVFYVLAIFYPVHQLPGHLMQLPVAFRFLFYRFCVPSRNKKSKFRLEIRILQLIAFLQSGALGKLYNVSIYTGMNGIYMKRTSLGKFPKTFSSILLAFKKLPACFHPAVL